MAKNELLKPKPWILLCHSAILLSHTAVHVAIVLCQMEASAKNISMF